jgi:hypothetical protein
MTARLRRNVQTYAGKPRKPEGEKRQRLDITLDPAVYRAMMHVIGTGSRSGFIEQLLRQEPRINLLLNQEK